MNPNDWQQAGQNALGQNLQSNGFNWQDAGMAGMAGGGLAGLLGGFLGGGGTDPASYMSGIPGTLSKYLGPYAQEGTQLMPQVQQGYQNEMNSPQFVASMGKGFTTDPGYQFASQQAQNAAKSSAAAGGMAGSPEAQQYAANIGNQMANQQYQQYLGHTMGAYNQGLQGLGGLETQGYGAAGSIASGLDQYMQMQAQLAAAQQAAQEKEAGSAIGGIGSLVSSIGSFF